jgi:hypothetical protein
VIPVGQRGRKISDQQRAAIEADLRRNIGTPEGAFRRVAERHDVAFVTVRRICDAAGIDPPDERRARTEKATDQQRASNAERRAELASRLLDVAKDAVDEMYQPATIYNFGGKDNTYNEKQVQRPPTGDRRNLATIAAIMMDKHKVLDMYDADARAGAALDRWLDHLTGEETP